MLSPHPVVGDGRRRLEICSTERPHQRQPLHGPAALPNASTVRMAQQPECPMYTNRSGNEWDPIEVPSPEEEADGYERQTQCPECFELRWNLCALPQPNVRWKDPIQRLQTRASGLCRHDRSAQKCSADLRHQSQFRYRETL